MNYILEKMFGNDYLSDVRKVVKWPMRMRARMLKLKKIKHSIDETYW